MFNKSTLDKSVFGNFADLSNNNSQAVSIKQYASAQHLLLAQKCTEGDYFFDSTWLERVTAAHDNRLSVLHYHFARPENGTPEAEADWFWHHCKPHFSTHYRDRVCVDIETSNLSGWPGYCKRFESRLRALTGQWSYNRLIGYTYLSAIISLGGQLRLGPGQWWIAALGPQQPPYKLPGGQFLWGWQYTNGAVGSAGPQAFAGIGHCDGSFLNQWTAQDLHRILRGSRLPRKRA